MVGRWRCLTRRLVAVLLGLDPPRFVHGLLDHQSPLLLALLTALSESGRAATAAGKHPVQPTLGVQLGSLRKDMQPSGGGAPPVWTPDHLSLQRVVLLEVDHLRHERPALHLHVLRNLCTDEESDAEQRRQWRLGAERSASRDVRGR